MDEAVRKLITSGYRTNALQVIWDERLAFTLTEGGAFKSVRQLDFMDSKDDDDPNFGAEIVAFYGTVHRAIQALLSVFGVSDTTDAANSQTDLDQGQGPIEGPDPLYPRAVEIVAETRKGSISWIQRRLKIGYNRAARLVERMEDEGVLSRPNAQGQREIFIEKAPA